MDEFGSIIGASAYGSIGFVRDHADLEVLERRLQHNLPVLERFKGIVVAANFGHDSRSLRADHAAIWRHRFPESSIIDSPFNRGHSIGTSDLDNMVFDHCKAMGYQWLCKSAHDILLDEGVLRIPVQPADFYFINAVSFDALKQHGFDLTAFTHGFFFPQTNFYAIDVTKVDYLIDPRFLDRTWERVQAIEHYNDRIWEHIPGWSCELLLREAVVRNGLARCSLTTDEQWEQILQVVIEQQITDCSFKGMRINGIQHDDVDPTRVVKAARRTHAVDGSPARHDS